MDFVKMHGAGNDFIIIEDLDEKLIDTEIEIAKKLCDRHFGIGADGLVLIRESNIADLKMVIINRDGSRANMCGNATRCFGRYAVDNNLIKGNILNLETGDGVKIIEIIKDGDLFKGAKVFMGKPSFEGHKFGVEDLVFVDKHKLNTINGEYIISSMLMGVPHTIVLKKEEEYDINEGKYIEKNSLFNEGTNVNFVSIIDRNTIKVKTWERGAGATLACGTGCCASVVYTVKNNFTNKVTKVIAPGGELLIEVNEEGVYMTGGAEYICKGKTM